MDTTMYNTIPAADNEPLVQTKSPPTSIKTLIFAAAATTLVLGRQTQSLHRQLASRSVADRRRRLSMSELITSSITNSL